MPFTIKSNFIIKQSAIAQARPLPTEKDQYWNNVSVLINGDTGIIDYKGNSLTTVNVAQSTSQKKYGNGSVSFTTVGSYLTVPHTGSIDFGSGDFTLEFWAYPTTNDSWRNVLSKCIDGGNGYASYRIVYRGSANGNYWGLLSNTNGTSDWNIAGTEAWNVAGTNGRFGTPSIGAWQHIAVSRNGNAIRCFKDGVLGTTINTSATLWQNTNTLKIGKGESTDTTNYFNGYMDDFRITKGIGRYTASFTPPSASFPIS